MLLIKDRLFKILQTVDNPIAKRLTEYNHTIDHIVITSVENMDAILTYITPDTFNTMLGKISDTVNCFDLSNESGLITFASIQDLKTLINTGVSSFQKSTCHYSSVFYALFYTRLIKSKPAKVFRKLYGNEFTEEQYADFGDKMSSAILAYLATTSGIKILSGEEIAWAYNENNYYDEGGELGSSCMRYPHCESYLQLYIDNPNMIGLVVALSDNLVIGRALLWKNKYYDRIYFNNETTKQNIIKFCEENGFISIYGSDIDESIQLLNWRYLTYPYMDTFRYLSANGVLYNKHEKNIILVNTDGTFDEYVYCPYCMKKQWAEILLDGVFCPSCYHWNDEHNEYMLIEGFN